VPSLTELSVKKKEMPVEKNITQFKPKMGEEEIDKWRKVIRMFGKEKRLEKSPHHQSQKLIGRIRATMPC
jgi:hypothetical protein